MGRINRKKEKIVRLELKVKELSDLIEKSIPILKANRDQNLAFFNKMSVLTHENEELKLTIIDLKAGLTNEKAKVLYYESLKKRSPTDKLKDALAELKMENLKL